MLKVVKNVCAAILSANKMDQAKELIEQRIKRIVGEFDFERRRISHPEECLCYLEGKSCHPGKKGEVNCLLCYCPEYDSDKIEGGCKINNPGGKWFYHKSLPQGKIWDCSDCDHPHQREVAEKHLRKIWGN